MAKCHPPPAGTGSHVELVQRLTRAESRIAALEGSVQTLEESRSKVPGWAAPAASLGAATLTSTAAFSGIFAIHWLSVRRQRRDEFFKRVQDAVELLNRSAREANRIWRLPGNNETQPAALELLQADVDGLTRRLTLLQKARSDFDLAEDLAGFISTAMLDIDDITRSANPLQADRAVRSGQTLQGKILQRYDQVFGKRSNSQARFSTRSYARRQDTVRPGLS